MIDKTIIENYPHHCVAIGDNAHANENFEIVIKIKGLEGRTIMTPEEQEVVFNLVRRMNFIHTEH